MLGDLPEIQPFSLDFFQTLVCSLSLLGVVGTRKGVIVVVVVVGMGLRS